MYSKLGLFLLVVAALVAGLGMSAGQFEPVEEPSLLKNEQDKARRVE